MSRSKTTNKDYARHPELIGDLEHVEWMKRPTFRALQWIRERKESEFKKPYLEDDHVKMEHWADWPYPRYTFPPFPNFPGPIPEDPSSPWNLRPGEEEEEIVELVCPSGVFCDPANPTTIAQSGSEILTVWSCPPPRTLTAEIYGPYTDNPERWKVEELLFLGGTYWAVTVRADADACGTCCVRFIDEGIPGKTPMDWADCYLKCDTGQWNEISTGSCVIPGTGTYIGDPGYGDCVASYTYELVSGHRKQEQDTCKTGTCSNRFDCDVEDEYCEDYCAGQNADKCATCGTTTCIDKDPTHEMPYYCTYDEGTDYHTYHCHCVKALRYYEWGCA